VPGRWCAAARYGEVAAERGKADGCADGARHV